MEARQIEAIHLERGDPRLPEFFAWCDEHGLFDATLGESGRMRRVYKGFPGREPTVSVSAAIAYDGPKPIGICLLEPQSEASHRARILHMDARRKQPKKELLWNFVDVGFLSVYVDPEHRMEGVARSLMSAMEEELAHRHRGSVGDRLMATAHGGAQRLVKGSRWLNLNPCSPRQGNWAHAISSHAEAAWTGEGGVKPAIGEGALLSAPSPTAERWSLSGTVASKLRSQRRPAPTTGSASLPAA